MSSERWTDLRDNVGERILLNAKERLKEDWELITEQGRKDLGDITLLLAECMLVESAGGNAALARAALSAALRNWQTSGVIRGSTAVDKFFEDVKEALIEGAEVAFQLLGASVKGILKGLV